MASSLFSSSSSPLTEIHNLQRQYDRAFSGQNLHAKAFQNPHRLLSLIAHISSSVIRKACRLLCLTLRFFRMRFLRWIDLPFSLDQSIVRYFVCSFATSWSLFRFVWKSQGLTYAYVPQMPTVMYTCIYKQCGFEENHRGGAALPKHRAPGTTQ
jgi:hypothetical protein